MGAILNKLNYLHETKEAIRSAIIKKDVDVSEQATFKSYVDAIDQIYNVDCNTVGFNVSYSDTEPEDTTKLWVKSQSPNQIRIKECQEFEPNIANLIYSTPINDSYAVVGNKIYVFGGASTVGWLTAIQCFDTTTNETTIVGNIAEPTNGGMAAAVGEKIYIFGGYGGTSKDWLGTVQCFDTTDNSIETLDVTVIKREFGATAVVGKKIYIFGGVYGSDGYKSTIECFDTETNTVTTLSASAACAKGCSVAAVGTDIYILRGYGSGTGSWGYTYDYNYHGYGDWEDTILVYKLDTITNTVSKTSLHMYIGQLRSMVSLGNKIYVFGGHFGDKLTNIAMIDASLGRSLSLGHMPIGVADHAAAVVGNSIYILGGNTSTGTTNAISRFNIEYVTNCNEMIIETSDDSCNYNLISSNFYNFSVPVKNVYVGDENNCTKFVDSYVYANDMWVSTSNILEETYYNINNWTKNMTSFPVFSNTFNNRTNTLSYQGGANFERIYIPVAVEKYHKYKFRFKFCSPTGFTMGTYGSNEEFAFVHSSAPSSTTTAALGYAPLGRSNAFNTVASDVPLQYEVEFRSGHYTTVYLAIDFGYILDGVTSTYVFKDIELIDIG